MGEHRLRDIWGNDSVMSVMLEVDDRNDWPTIKWAIRKRIDAKKNGKQPFSVQLVGIKKMRDDKAPHGPVCALVTAIDVEGTIHYLTAKLPAAFYRIDLYNVIDGWMSELGTIAKEQRLGNHIYTAVEYRSQMGRTIGESPIEAF